MDSEQSKRKIFVTMNLSIACIAAGAALSLFVINSHFKILMWGTAFYSLSSCLLHFAAKFITSLKLLCNTYLTLWIGFACVMAYGSSGVSGPMAPAFIPIPLIALIFLNRIQTTMWAIIVGAAYCVLSFLSASSPLEEEWAHLIFHIAIVIVVLVTGIIHHTFTEKYHKQTKDNAEKLHQTQSQLVQSGKLAALGELSAGVAHEINNPLGVMSMRASQIERLHKQGKLTDEYLLKFSKEIQNGVVRISKIINGFRTFARDSQNDPYEKTHIKEIIDDVLDLAHDRLSSKSVDLIVDLGSEQLAIECRKIQIAQIIINLVNNSYDAIKESENPWIKISVQNQESNATILVTDSGKGIPEEIRNKILDPFFTTKPVGEGTGIGLSISARIVQEHNGTLSINHECENTQFVLTIPKKYNTKKIA